MWHVLPLVSLVYPVVIFGSVALAVLVELSSLSTVVVVLHFRGIVALRLIPSRCVIIFESFVMSQLTAADSKRTGSKAASKHASLKESQTNANTEQSSANYKEAFSLFDKRGNGHVAAESLGDLLRACGQNPTLAEIKELKSGVGSDCELLVVFL